MEYEAWFKLLFTLHFSLFTFHLNLVCFKPVGAPAAVGN